MSLGILYPLLVASLLAAAQDRGAHAPDPSNVLAARKLIDACPKWGGWIATSSLLKLAVPLSKYDNATIRAAIIAAISERGHDEDGTPIGLANGDKVIFIDRLLF